MDSKEQKSNKNSPVFSEFTQLFRRKLQENFYRKNQNPAPPVVIKKLKSVYAYEIGCMMHILGDVANPLRSSVRYLETIVRDQMTLLVNKASEVVRPKASLHVRLLKLIAHNKQKVMRLLQYLYLKDLSQCIGKKKYEELIENVENDAQFRKRVKACLKILRSIGAGDYDPETVKGGFDGITLERMARRFQMSRKMSKEEYLEFSIKQSACFYPKGDGGKFKRWILADQVKTVQPTPLSLDILSFFARETVAEIVEASLKIDRSKKPAKLNLDYLNILTHMAANETKTFSNSELDVLSSKRLRFADLVPNGAASFSDISYLMDSGSLGLEDIFAVSASMNLLSTNIRCNENDVNSPTEEPPPINRRRIETMDSHTKSNNDKSDVRKMESFQESRFNSDLKEPEIPPRNPDDPITVEDLKTVVMNLIIVNQEKNRVCMKKKILCLH